MKLVMKRKHIEIIFPVYLIGLLMSTYTRVGEYYILAVAIIILFLKFYKLGTISFRIKKNQWSLFVCYYFIVSVVGLITGYVGIKNLSEFLLKYVIMPYTLFLIIPGKEKVANMLRIIKTLVLISALFGFVEYYMRYNPMINFVQLSNREWMIRMNGLSNYQPCSFFLHYNYFGCVLVTGIVLNKYFPYKKSLQNIGYYLLTISQLILCQSRICWISLGFIGICWFLTSSRITSKTIKGFGIALILISIVIIFEPSVISSIGKMISSRFNSLIVYGFEDGSLGQRLGTLFNWPNYFFENIVKGVFGTGYQSISVDFMPKYSYFFGYSTADCELTVYLIETGLIGTLLAIFAIVRFIKMQIKSKTNVTMFCAVGFTGFLVECATLDIVANNIIFCLMLMCIIVGMNYTSNQF